MPILPSKALPATPRAARRAGDDYGLTAQPDWRTIDWRRELKQVEVAGRSINYVDLGDSGATPVLFIHGLGGQWQNWLENLPRVSQERRVIALDLPGFGFSEMPEQDITIPAYGRWVDAFCQKLGLESVVAVGNSMGGFIAAELAIQFPRLVERIALVSPAGISNVTVRRDPLLTFIRAATAVTTASAARHRKLAIRPALRHFALAWVARHPTRLKPDLVFEGMMRGVGKPGFFDALEACLEYDFRERLGEISCPVLLIWGKKDGILPVRDAEEFHRRIPHARKVIMEDTGHVAMLERPKTFNDLLLEYVDEPVDKLMTAEDRGDGAGPTRDREVEEAAQTASPSEV